MPVGAGPHLADGWAVVSWKAGWAAGCVLGRVGKELQRNNKVSFFWQNTLTLVCENVGALKMVDAEGTLSVVTI